MSAEITAERLVAAVAALRELRSSGDMPCVFMRHLLLNTGMICQIGERVHITAPGHEVLGLPKGDAQRFGVPPTDPDYPICTADKILRYLGTLRDMILDGGMDVDITKTCRNLAEIKAVEALGLSVCTKHTGSHYHYKATVAGYLVAGYCELDAIELGEVVNEKTL